MVFVSPGSYHYDAIVLGVRFMVASTQREPINPTNSQGQSFIRESSNVENVGSRAS